MSNTTGISFLAKAPLLLTESVQEFEQLAMAMVERIAPDGILAEVLVNDVIHATWDILRYQRCRTPIIQSAYRPALINLLQHATGIDELEAELLANGWFKTKAGKQEVTNRLGPYHLDETAIGPKRSSCFARSLKPSTGCWPRPRPGATRRCACLRSFTQPPPDGHARSRTS